VSDNVLTAAIASGSTFLMAVLVMVQNGIVLHQIEKRFESFQGRIDDRSTHFEETVSLRFDRVDERLESLDTRLKDIESEQRRIIR